ncbi:hypothetical protein BDV06DRAFT_187911 [Aspergillus oleicola]
MRPIRKPTSSSWSSFEMRLLVLTMLGTTLVCLGSGSGTRHQHFSQLLQPIWYWNNHFEYASE